MYFCLYRNKNFNSKDELENHGCIRGRYDINAIDKIHKMYYTDNTHSMKDLAEMCGFKDGNRIKAIFKKHELPTLTKSQAYHAFNLKEKLEKTNMEKYGVKSVAQSKDVIAKMEKTRLERYGNKHYTKTQHYKEKAKQTNLKKYGVEFFTQTDEYKEKAKQTNLKKYGVEQPLTLDSQKEKTKQTNLKKYGVEHFSQSKEYHQRKIENSNAKYGTDYPQQNEQHKQKVYANRLLKIRKVISSFGIDDALFNDIDISKVPLSDKLTKEVAEMYLGIIDADINVLHDNYTGSTINKHGHNLGLSDHFNTGNRSSQEIRLTDFLDELNITYTTNDRNIITPKELDIYIPSHNLAIEVNGVYWHRNDKNKHIDKKNDCVSKEIQLLQFTDLQINDNFDIVTSIIKSKLGLCERVYARKCKIIEVHTKVAKTFHNENHLDGYSNSSFSYGLQYNDELLMVLSFGKMRFGDLNGYELIRMSSKQGITVIGGLSRLVRHFKRLYNGNLYSYANMDISDGIGYYKAGFEFVKFTQPSKFYLLNNTMRSRLSFTKDKVKKMFDDYNGDNLDVFLMRKNIYPYYTCGSMLFVI